MFGIILELVVIIIIPGANLHIVNRCRVFLLCSSNLILLPDFFHVLLRFRSFRREEHEGEGRLRF